MSGQTGQGQHDVIVIGGGPAGAATATLVARQGRRVLLLERERFPRFRIGESLMPATYWSLERLGVIDKMRGSAFPRKHSVQFYLKDGRPTRPFYFSETDAHESSITWQVERADFDRMLLDHAAESGVDVRQEVAVREVLFDGDRATGVRAEFPGRMQQELVARVIVDATGQSALLSRHLGLKKIDPNLKNAAMFARYRGARRDAGIDAGATVIMHTRNEDSWFWVIPLPDEVTSIGVVGSLEYLVRTRAADPERVFAEEIALCPALGARIAGAERISPVRVQRDFSYVSRRLAGDGWILTGDAFGFLDPIYSSGVFLALKSAEFAADAIDGAFRSNDFSAAALGRFGPRFIAGMEALRRVVYAYYSRDFSFARFLKHHPACKDDVIHLLTGNVYRHPVNGLLEALDRELPLPGYQPLSLPGESS